MFWKRTKPIMPSVVTSYGTFTWDGTFSWSCHSPHADQSNELTLTYIGCEFDPEDLIFLKDVLDNLPTLSSLALTANRSRLEHYGHKANQMSLSGITINSDGDEDICLEFSFEDWPDGGLSVYWKDNQIVRSEIDD